MQSDWRPDKFTLTAIVVFILGLFNSLALGGGGQVIPASATPKGYSLSEMAKATSFFNTGSRAPDTYPNTPFQILYYYVQDGTQLTFTVSPGTMFYVPVFYSDDTQPAPGFPQDVNDRDAVLRYVFAPGGFGAVNIQIVVDGIPNFLGPDYMVGVGPVKLADDGGFGPGNQYIVYAAFLTPLTKGNHTVQIKGNTTGALGFPEPIDITFQVTVR
jgi:hypothetical protein